MARTRAPKTPVVHVVLDTNVLFTEAEDRLLNNESSSLILKETKDLGVDLHWHLPEVVRLERRSQMYERAIKLLVPLAKLERLLGHKLNMTEDIVGLRVDEAITRQIANHSLEVTSLNAGAVEWNILIAAAANRTPPFSPTGTEKGFKDAIVLETYCQIANSVPRTNSRVVLLTADELLSQAAKSRSASFPNASVARDGIELKTLLNAIAAHLSDDAVSHILPRAKKLFFTKNDQKSLWFTWEMKSKFTINGIHVSKIPYDHGFKTSLVNIPPLKYGLSKKEGQRIFFSTVVVYNIQSRKTFDGTKRLPSSMGLLSQFGVSDPSNGDSRYANALLALPMTHAPISDSQEEITMYGSATFDVRWSALLTKRGSLIKPQLEGVEHREVDWSDVPPNTAGSE